MYVPHGVNASISKIVKQFTSLPVGVIGGINQFELHRLPEVGQTLVTTIRVVAGVANALVVESTVTCEEELIATCNMKVFITE